MSDQFAPYAIGQSAAVREASLIARKQAEAAPPRTLPGRAHKDPVSLLTIRAIDWRLPVYLVGPSLWLLRFCASSPLAVL